MKKIFIEGWKSLNRGNMWILATGLLVGAAFGAVVTSLANDVIMQAIAKIFNVDGVKMLSIGTTKWTLDTQGNKIEPLNGIMYGKFLSSLLAFIIIMLFVFISTVLVITITRKIIRKKDKAVVTPPPSVEQLILEELKKINSKPSKTKPSKSKK